MKIITDSAALFSFEEREALGIAVIPACVIIDGKTYKDYEDIDSDTFLRLIAEGKVPTSSQPAIGEVMEVFEGAEEEILCISIADGLSGTYQNACGAKNCMEKNNHIHIMNTRSLAGPQRYCVKKALALRDAGCSMEEIKEKVQESIETSVSFVIPADFDFLKRSGRLTPIAAKIGGMIKIVPVMTQTEDKTRIAPFAIKRSWKKAEEAIIKHLKTMGVDKQWLISIGHAGSLEKAGEIAEQMKVEFSDAEIELLQLTPSLITHGGPGCVTIQAVRK